MIAIAPSDDAWGFLVSVYHYQAGRERERGGAADPCPSSFLEMSCHDPKAGPCPPVFRKKPEATPIHRRRIRPLSISGKADSGKVGGSRARAYIRAYMHIYMYIGANH